MKANKKSEYFHPDELLSPAMRRSKHYEKLETLIARVRKKSPYYKKLYQDIPLNLKGEELLQSLPFVSKSGMKLIQTKANRLGALSNLKVGQYQRLFASPGPIYEPGLKGDWWRMAQALYASGIRKNDIIQNCFAYHFTPAGFMVEGGAFEIGAAVIPAGVGNTDLQVEVMEHYQASSYVGTPDFLKLIIEKAEQLGIALPHLKSGCVSGGALFPSLRAFYNDRGIKVFQCLAAADFGLVAFETSYQGEIVTDGLVVAEDIIVELIDPNTKLPIESPNLVGEIVVTKFDDKFPLIRYATGDLSAWSSVGSPCGRSNRRIKGWMGRVDLVTKIRGMFVHPSQLEVSLAKFKDRIKQYSLIVEQIQGIDQASLHLVLNNPNAFDGLITEVKESLKSHCRISLEVILKESLPSDAKPIEDLRKLG